MKTTIAILAALCLATTATAQQPQPDGPAPADADKQAPFVFDAGEIELDALVDRCARYLHRNILLSDTELQGATQQPQRRGRNQPQQEEPPAVPTVTFELPVTVDAHGCEELLSGLLWRHGLAIVPLDEQKAVYEVLAMNGPRAREIVMRAVQRTPAEVLARPTLRQFVLTVYELEHTNAQLANNSLRPFFAQFGSSSPVGGLNIGNIGNKRSVLLSGPQDLVANALRVLQAADKPDPELDESLEERLRRIEAKIGL